MIIYQQKRVIDQNGRSPSSTKNAKIRCGITVPPQIRKVIYTRQSGKVSTIVASQLPVEKWYGMIGEATFAEAILDRLIHRAVRVNLKGESMRKQGLNLTDADQSE